MCYKSCQENTDNEGIGWKIFTGKNKKLFSTSCAPKSEQTIPRPINKWLRATVYSGWDLITLGLFSTKHWDRSGWMIFECEEDAIAIADAYPNESPIVKKVAWRDSEFLGIVGWTCERETLVRQAKLMKILPVSQQ